jgi:hypothetical protein
LVSLDFIDLRGCRITDNRELGILRCEGANRDCPMILNKLKYPFIFLCEGMVSKRTLAAVFGRKCNVPFFATVWATALLIVIITYPRPWPYSRIKLISTVSQRESVLESSSSTGRFVQETSSGASTRIILGRDEAPTASEVINKPKIERLQVLNSSLPHPGKKDPYTLYQRLFRSPGEDDPKYAGSHHTCNQSIIKARFNLNFVNYGIFL